MHETCSVGSPTNPSLQDVQHNARWPVTNDPESPLNAKHRKRFVVAGKVHCPSCQEWKGLDEFHKAKNLPFGICGICKECAKARTRAHYRAEKANSAFRDADGKLTLSKKRLPKKWERKPERVAK